MDSFIYIKLMPDQECSLGFLRNTLFQKLHKALWDLQATDIGISFPQCIESQYTKLGCVMRIHAAKQRLEQLQALHWLGGLAGYCKVSDVLPVPSELTGYQSISRIRHNMSLSRMQKKIAHQKSKGYLQTDEDIKTYEKWYKAKMFSMGLSNPYLELQSISTAHKYRLYLAFSALQPTPILGEFNTFGLSNTATVPIFDMKS